MGKTGVRVAAVAALLALALSIPSSGANENRVVCYYTNWSVYRPGTAKFSPQNINPYLCTHLIYAFGGFTKENSLKPFDKYQDIEKGGYAKFTGLKTYNKQLKTMLAIGGWNEGSSRFSPMVASADRRKELVRNAIKFLRQNHFDGLDLDWEYPAFRDGGKSRDRENYAQLVQELREEFDRESQKTGRPRLLLTMAVPAGLEYIDKGYDIPKLNKYLDWMNILSYDYHSAFEPAVNHHSPLYSLEESEDDEYNFDVDLNIDATIKHYLKAGADREKLVLGIPTYGRSYTLFNPDANEIGAPADGPGDMGEATRENGYLAYYEICDNVKNGEWKVIQPNPRAMGPYAYKANQWVGYDDELIVRRKAEYVAQMGLGGIMFWALDNDDFRGVCHNKPYPLIEAGKEALTNAATDNLVDKKAIAPIRSRGSTTTETSSPVRNSGGRQGVSVDDDSSKPPRNRKRVRPGTKQNAAVQQKTRTGTRRRARPTTVSTTPSTTTSVVTHRTSTTPEPPTTPDPGSDFKCEDEGFFPHPRDCKKYFWCLSSGPSGLGIVAHQFTCPSGLYFNKAADSCDYTQNVLCNKKLKKATTATTTTTAVTTAEPSTTTKTTTETNYYNSFFSTRRPPPKITAATSRTTYIYTTPTTTRNPIEYDEEYEEYEDEDEDLEKDVDSEEDPRVIKELIDLIKKVGGVEQLEKYLQLQENGTATSKIDFTTPATISKSLYERVLSQSGGTTNSLLNTLANRSRDTNRGRPQYTSISRNRPQSIGEKDFEEEASQSTARETATRPGSPEYVTIRRQRLSTTSAPSELEYVTLRRQSNRYSPEETTTSKYTTIVRRRPTTDASDLDTTDDSNVKPVEEIIEEIPGKGPAERDDREILAVSVQLPTVETTSTVTEPPSPTASSATEKSTPQLFRPRPFTRPRTTKTPAVSTTTTEQPTTRKVSRPLFLRRPPHLRKPTQVQNTTKPPDVASTTVIYTIRPPRIPNRRKNILTTTPHDVSTSTVAPSNVSVSTLRSRFRFATRKPYRPSTASTTQATIEDQELGNAGEIAVAVHGLSTAPLPREPITTTTPIPRFGRISTTLPPQSVSTSKSILNNLIPQKTQTFERFITRVEAVPQRTTQYFPTYGKFPATAPTESELAFFHQTITRPTSSPQTTAPRPVPIENTSQRGLQTEIYTRVRASVPQVVETIPVRVTELEYTGSTLPTPISRPVTIEQSHRPVQYQQIRLSTPPPQLISRPSAVNPQKTLDYPRVSSAAPQIIEIQSNSPRQYARLPPNPQITSRPSDGLPPARGLTPEEFARLSSPKSQIIPGLETPRSVTTSDRSPRITLIARPSSPEYDYYDSSVLSQLPPNSKVLVLPSGAVQCLDRGNFPHPESCKKFISCFEGGVGDGIVGYEYTCPRGLSFDPIGGICNWSAGLGCNK